MTERFDEAARCVALQVPYRRRRVAAPLGVMDGDRRKHSRQSVKFNWDNSRLYHPYKRAP
jgi:hypothetical protein